MNNESFEPPVIQPQCRNLEYHCVASRLNYLGILVEAIGCPPH